MVTKLKNREILRDSLDMLEQRIITKICYKDVPLNSSIEEEIIKIFNKFRSDFYE